MTLSSPQLAFTALLAIAAWSDLTARRIANAIPVALAVAGAGAVWAASGPLAALGAAGMALAVFVVLTFAWSARLLGGGDLKLAVGCAVWVGPGRLVSWLVVTAIAGGLLAAICYAASSAEARLQIRANVLLAPKMGMPRPTLGQTGGRVSVPYGVAIAAGSFYAVVLGG